MSVRRVEATVMGYRVAGFVVVFGACSLNVNVPEGAPSDASQEADAASDADPGTRACVLATSAGRDHTCAVRTDGTVWCWGSNQSGQLGDNTLIDRLVPVQVQGLADIKAVDGGGTHSCALSNTGEVRCWGSNSFGQLGDNTRVDSKTP